MNTHFRNAVLVQLQSKALGSSTVQDRLHFRAGQTLECPSANAPQIVLPQLGVLLLQNTEGGKSVDVGLLGAANGLVVPMSTRMTWRMQALREGWAHVFQLPADAMVSSADVLLKVQQRLLEQVAIWGYCRQHHALPQRLATLLMVLCDDAGEWDWSAWSGLLNVNASFLQAGLQALEKVEAVTLRANRVTIQQADLLKRQTCSCLGRLKTLTTGD